MMNNNKNTITLLVGSALTLGAYLYLKSETAQAVKDAGNAIDPLNQDNIFNTYVNDVGAALTGNENFKLGAYIYDLFND